MRALLLACLAAGPAGAEDYASAPVQRERFEWLDFQLDAGLSYDDNVNRGDEHLRKLSDQLFTLNLSKGLVISTGSHTRLLLNGFAGYEKFDSYHGLDRLYGGAQGEFQYRPSGAFGAPIYGIFARLSRDEFRSAQRDGYRYSSGLTLRKPLTDRISLFSALAFSKRDADEETFDTSDTSLRFNLDYAATARGTLYLGGELRRGDQISSGPPWLESVDLASSLVEDDVFAHEQFLNYRFKARTVLTTIGYNLPLGAKSSLDLSWRHAKSMPTENLSFAGEKPYYTDDQLSLIYLLSF